MQKNVPIVLVVLALIIVALVVLLVTGDKGNSIPVVAPTEMSESPQPPPQPPMPLPPSSTQSGASVASSEHVVTYNGTAYTPSAITIKKGDKIIYKNESEEDMWPASAIHPSHGEYPTTGGCLGSTFDACKGVAPGSSWSFVFDVTGNWKYHDHLNPLARGAITVQ